MTVQDFLRSKILGWKLHQPENRPEFFSKVFNTSSLQESMDFSQEVTEIAKQHKIDPHVTFSLTSQDALVILRSPAGALPEEYQEIAKEINDHVLSNER